MIMFELLRAKNRCCIGFVFTIWIQPLYADLPQTVVENTVRAHGGKDQFYKLRDVEYQLVFRDLRFNKINISIERYLFDSERSYGGYTKHEFFPIQNIKENVVQLFDGQNFLLFFDKTPIYKNNLLNTAKYFRKRNYFLFSLPFKLLDKGLKYEWKEWTENNMKMFQIIEVHYPKNKIRLFIDHATNLIQQFVYYDEIVKKILLCKITYERINGLFLGTHRLYFAADWDGLAKGAIVFEEHLKNIQFWNGYSPKDFISP